MSRFLRHIIASLFVLMSVTSFAQAMYFKSATVGNDLTDAVIEAENALADSALYRARSLDELHAHLDTINIWQYDPKWKFRALPPYAFGPAVYNEYQYPDTAKVTTPLFSDNKAMRWLEEENALSKRLERMNYYLFFNHPERVNYNINLLPEAPKRYHAVVDPQKHTIEIQEVVNTDVTTTLTVAEVKKRHWIRTFNASLHFSQAYVSPNWYQGGKNNINVIGNIFYNVKLNPQYHDKILFETTAQYKLGMNSAPDDTIHGYNITDDLFQVNTTFGIKAAHRWYYSFTGQFKTQLLNSFNSNSTTMRSAFLSPGELTAGVGMTYNYANSKKTVTLDASIAPLSYSLKTCINDEINPEQYGIDPGLKCKHSFGSSGEVKFFWKICYNISFRSRLFAFTDYNSAQADWENTLLFDINRFLSTQIFAHARYDTKTPTLAPNPDGTPNKWKKLQVKEILSIGFTYKFSSI